MAVVCYASCPLAGADNRKLYRNDFRLLAKKAVRPSSARTAFCIFRAGMTGCIFAVCICTCEENKGLQREYLFAAGFPIGARSIPVGTRFCSAKSSVLYLCFRLTRERGWRRTLRCGRVWRQTLFRGSRTGGFCDVSYSTNAGI